MSTFYGLPAAGETVALYTHLVVREDAHMLFGFGTEGERRLFRGLLKVSGVGPKIALGILSGSSVEDFLRIIEAEDAAMLTRIPGIGRKTAERVIIEMRDNVQKFAGAGARRRMARRPPRPSPAQRGIRRTGGARVQAAGGDAAAEGGGRAGIVHHGTHPPRAEIGGEGLNRHMGIETRPDHRGAGRPRRRGGRPGRAPEDPGRLRRTGERARIRWTSSSRRRATAARRWIMS